MHEVAHGSAKVSAGPTPHPRRPFVAHYLTADVNDSAPPANSLPPRPPSSSLLQRTNSNAGSESGGQGLNLGRVGEYGKMLVFCAWAHWIRLNAVSRQ